jgi:hypothetical protein
MIKYTKEEKEKNAKVLEILALYNVSFNKIEKELQLPQGIISKSISGKTTCFKHTEALNQWCNLNIIKP